MLLCLSWVKKCRGSPLLGLAAAAVVLNGVEGRYITCRRGSSRERKDSLGLVVGTRDAVLVGEEKPVFRRDQPGADADRSTP